MTCCAQECFTCIEGLPSIAKLRRSLILGALKETAWSSVFPSLAFMFLYFSCTNQNQTLTLQEKLHDNIFQKELLSPENKKL